MFKRIKKAINNSLKKLAIENKKTYGKGSLDCCRLNRQTGERK